MAKEMKKRYTQQGYQELLNELNYRKGELREKIKNDIAVARSFGDLSENAEYDAARNEQGINEARIKELEELVENAVVIDEASIDSSVVSLGSTVTVRISDGKSESEVTYSLVGSNEADPFSGKISDLSPIGAGLVEMREGEEKEIETPSGTIRIKVLKVSRTNA